MGFSSVSLSISGIRWVYRLDLNFSDMPTHCSAFHSKLTSSFSGVSLETEAEKFC